jgi:maltose O-acetyltransferase
MSQFIRLFALVCYYGFARHLPASSNPLGLGFGRMLRRLLCARIFKRCGKGANIERGAYFGLGRGVIVGSNSGIGINARFYGVGEITIGNNVIMGPDVAILTENHRFADVTQPIGGQGKDVAPVVIEDDVWIGIRVIVLPGVTIGRSSVIAAGAVVTRDIPAFSIAAGVPARVIGRRDGRSVSGDA